MNPKPGEPGHIPDDAPIPLLTTYGKLVELMGWFDTMSLCSHEDEGLSDSDAIAIDFVDSIKGLLTSLHEAVRSEDINRDINTIGQP